MRSFLVLFLAVAVMGQSVQEFLQKQFQAFDANKDHHVTFDDFQLLFKTMDADGNGKVTVAEYVKASSTTLERGTNLFKLMDSSQDGALDITEVKAIFTGFDTNGDGTISRQEFDTTYTGFVTQLGLSVTDLQIIG